MIVAWNDPIVPISYMLIGSLFLLGILIALDNAISESITDQGNLLVLALILAVTLLLVGGGNILALIVWGFWEAMIHARVDLWVWLALVLGFLFLAVYLIGRRRQQRP